jgi:polysaccharide biosynthesis transport protein
MNMHDRAIVDRSMFQGPAPSGGSTQDVLRVLRRHLRLLMITAAVVMGAALVTYLVLEPRYDATAVMRVAIDDWQPSADQTAASVRDAEQLRTHQIETQIQLLGSRPVARQTVNDLALYDDREFNPAADPDKPAVSPIGRMLAAIGFGSKPAATTPAQSDKPSPQVIERTTGELLRAVKVKQDGQSDFLTVTVSSHNAGKATRIANKLVANYLSMQVAERRSSRRQAVDVLARQVGELRRDLLQAELAAAAYRRDHRIDAGPGRDADVAQMARLGSELAAAGAGRAEGMARSGSRGQVMSSLLADLQSQQTVVQRRLAELSTLYGAAHPDVLKATAELGQIRSGIATESNRIQQQFANEASAQSARESELAGSLGAMRAQSLQRGIASVPLADLERNAETARTVYVGLLQRLQEARRLQEMVRPDATIASPALLPTQSSFPRGGQIFGVAAGAALLLGLILVLLAEALENQVRTSADVLTLVDLPTFGMIPEITTRRRGWHAHLTVAKQPYSLFAEAIRMTEGKLHRFLTAHSGKVVMVTSPLPADGKTTVAIGLAAAAVATGRTAVMLDLDLRRPGLRDVLDGTACEHDLLDYLAGRATLADVLIASPALPSLMAIPVRNAAEDPGAALASPRLAELLSILREQFDLIVINTPPVLATGDAQTLVDLVDATLLVLRWGRTTPDLVRAAVEELDSDVTGVVFNRVRFAKHARLGYGDGIQHYRKFGAYFPQDGATGLGRLRWRGI